MYNNSLHDIPVRIQSYHVNWAYKQLCSVYEDIIAVVAFVCTVAMVQASLQQLLLQLQSWTVFCCCEVTRETLKSNIISFPTLLAVDWTCYAFSAPL